jgi:hypothetical protein
MPNEPLKVDPAELLLTADQLDAQASGFIAAHRTSHSRASQVALGAGNSAAALPAMLAAWDSDGERFGKNFITHAANHREAASSYAMTDAYSADGIDDAGSAL